MFYVSDSLFAQLQKHQIIRMFGLTLQFTRKGSFSSVIYRTLPYVCAENSQASRSIRIFDYDINFWKLY